MSPTEVAVVGAGPAGIAAAVSAHRLGLDVVVIDKATFPRDKCCGDGLTTLALRELDRLGIDAGDVPSWQPIDDISLRAPGGRHVDLSLPSGNGLFAAVVRRSEFDHRLVEHAKDLGIDVREGVEFQSIDHDTRRGVVHLGLRGGESLTARHVVAADGMWSPVRKAVDARVDGYRGDWHAMRQYRTATGPASRRLWVWFDADLLPGYAWSFPLPDDRVNLGFGIVRGAKMSGKELKAIWSGLVDRPHVREVLGDSEAEGPHKAWPIPANMANMTLRHGRVLFVGDAAAVTDPMTGEGIGQALETGRLAATAISQGGPSGAVAKRYDDAVRRSLQADHTFARRLSRVLSRPGLTDAALRSVDLNDWTRRNFARWMFEDYPRAALLTPSRWRRGLFSRPGAFDTAA